MRGPQPSTTKQKKNIRWDITPRNIPMANYAELNSPVCDKPLQSFKLQERVFVNVCAKSVFVNCPEILPSGNLT